MQKLILSALLLYTISLLGNPEITSVIPSHGPNTGNTAIQISGKGFSGSSAVNFSNIPAASFSVQSDSLITAISPQGFPGTVDITVTNGGTSSITSQDRFTYTGDWFAYVSKDNGKDPSTVDVINLTNFTGTFTSIATGGDQLSFVAITPDNSNAYVVDKVNGLKNFVPYFNTVGSDIPLAVALAIAINPNGTQADVTTDNDIVVPITLPNTLGTPIPTQAAPDQIAITPDGTRTYIVNTSSDSITTFFNSNPNVTTVLQLPVFGVSPNSIAMNPDGKTAYIPCCGTDALVLLDIETNTFDPNPISVPTTPFDIAVTPDGLKAYVLGSNPDDASAVVTPINLVNKQALTAIDFPLGTGYKIAVAPDGKTAYVTITTSNSLQAPPPPVNLNGLIAIDVASDTLDGLKSTVLVESSKGVAITPDPSPVAAFKVTPQLVGKATLFDGSASISPVGTIVSWAWDFGDGSEETTSSPLVSHVYKKAGNFTVTLTVTNSAGTSTKQVFTGQTMSRNGSLSLARLSQTITLSDIVKPPTHLRGKQHTNKFLTQTDIYNAITWQAPVDGITPKIYRIYRDKKLTKLIGTVSARGPLEFKDHNRKKNKTYTYYIVSVDASNNASVAASLVVEP